MRTIFLTAALALLTACSPGPAPGNGTDPDAVPRDAPKQTAAPAPTPVPVPAAPAPVDAVAVQDGATQGGDGSALVLSPLRLEDGAVLTGELGCSFTLDRRGAPILLGKADVGANARGQAVVRIGNVAERLVSRREGGFGAMERGPVFGGRGMTITIRPGDRVSGGESPARRATLLAQRGDGAERRWDGFWTCGP